VRPSFRADSPDSLNDARCDHHQGPASAAYLSASDLFRQEVHASAIALFTRPALCSAESPGRFSLDTSSVAAIAAYCLPAVPSLVEATKRMIVQKTICEAVLTQPSQKSNPLRSNRTPERVKVPPVMNRLPFVSRVFRA
jgi:hypothetical protein